MSVLTTLTKKAPQMNTYIAKVGVIAAAGLLCFGTANAAPVNCAENAPQPFTNYMQIDDSMVSACLASGYGNGNDANGVQLGNLTGNASNDPYLYYHAPDGSESAGKSDGANPYNISYNSTTVTFDSSFWDDYSSGAIGFKFGTGGDPDEWFVYQLIAGVTSVDWTFFNVPNQRGQVRGGGLSHVNLYGIPGTTVAAPVTLALLGLGLFALASVRRQRGLFA